MIPRMRDRTGSLVALNCCTVLTTNLVGNSGIVTGTLSGSTGTASRSFLLVMKSELFQHAEIVPSNAMAVEVGPIPSCGQNEKMGGQPSSVYGRGDPCGRPDKPLFLDPM